MENFENLSKEERDRLLILLKNTRLEPSFKDFQPHDAQGALWTSEANETLFIAGNQSGKTQGAVILVLMWATGVYPDWMPLSCRMPIPNRGRIIGPDLTNWVNEILEPKIKQWLPMEYVNTWKNNPQTKGVDRIEFKNGSVIDVLSYKQDRMAFESWTGNWIWGDEPPERSHYIACIRGLAALNGRIVLTLTPLSEPWIYQLSESCRDVKQFGKASYAEGGRVLDLGSGKVYTSKIRVIHAKTDDNLKQKNWLGKEAGGMSPEGLAFFISTLSDEEQQVRRYGAFVHLQGLIYKSFNESIHVVDDNSVPKLGTMFQVLDPADAKPHAVAWYRVDPMNNCYCVLDASIDGNLDVLVDKIKEIETQNNFQTMFRILDPNKGRTPTSVSRRTWQEELYNRGLWMDTEVNDDIALGHQLVKTKLAYNKLIPLDETNHPHLFFAREGARNTIFSLKNYIYDTNLNHDKHDRFKATPRDKFKDFPDCLRYFCMSNPEWKSVV